MWAIYYLVWITILLIPAIANAPETLSYDNDHPSNPISDLCFYIWLLAAGNSAGATQFFFVFPLIDRDFLHGRFWKVTATSLLVNMVGIFFLAFASMRFSVGTLVRILVSSIEDPFWSVFMYIPIFIVIHTTTMGIKWLFTLQESDYHN